MPDAGVVAEFLAKLGFDVDESSMKAFKYSLSEATKSVGELGLAMTSVSLAIADGMKRITDQFAGLHYFSQRTGTTVRNLQDMAYAAQQAGGSADAMGAAVKRTYDLMQLPGGAGIGMMGVYGGVVGQVTSARQGLEVEMGHWAQMYKDGQQWFAKKDEESLGYDAEALDPILRNWDTFLAKQKEAAQHISDMGLDPDKFADDSAKMQRSWNQLGFDIKLSGQAFAADWVKPVTEGIDAVTTLIEKLQVDFSHFDLQERRKFEAAAIPVAALGLIGMAALALKTFRGVFGLEGGAGIFGRVFGAGVRGGLVGGALGALGMGVDPIPEYNPSGQPGAGWTPPPGYEAPLDRLWQWLNRPGPAAAPGATAPALPSPAGAPLGMSWTIPTKSFFHKESYDPGGDDELIPSGRPNPLLQSAAFRPQSDAESDAESDLRDWLRGNSAFVPKVQLSDFGFGSPGDAGGTGMSGGYGGSAASLFPGPTAPPVGKARAALVQGLYAHLRAAGLDRDHTLAMLGNANAESSFNAAGAIGSSGERGLFQWLGSRQAAMHAALGDKWLDPYAELDYALAEQRKRDPGWFTRSGSEFDLTNDWERGFERPKNIVDRSSYTKAVENVVGALLKSQGFALPPLAASKGVDTDGSAAQYDREMFGPHAKLYDQWNAAVRDEGNKETWAHFLAAHMRGAHLVPSVTNHHAGDKHVTINQAPMNVTVHGSAADAAKHLGDAHSRALQDAVRNVTPLLQ